MKRSPRNPVARSFGKLVVGGALALSFLCAGLNATLSDVPRSPRPPLQLASTVWAPLPRKTPEVVLARPAGPPMSLTSSDGTGLELVSLTARAVVEDPLAFTELKLVFRNPQARQLEGQFEITLPPGAVLSRFAMRQGDRWQEGEVVELQAAREAYEDFLHRRQDPALLEKQAGNQFRARVFPIPPSGEKELILSYSEERPRADGLYRIYLRGLPKLSRLDLRAIVAKSMVQTGASSSLGGTTVSHQTVDVQKQDFRPDVDFEVPVPVAPGGGSWVGVRHENLAVARITPVPVEAAAAAEPLDAVVVLFDTSASRALGYAAQLDGLSAIVAALKQKAGPKAALRVVAFDQEIEEVYNGSVGDFGAGPITRLRERRPLGASDLAKALGYVAGQRSGMHRLVLLTDGVATAGQTEAKDLKQKALALGNAGVRRIDAVTFGGIRDEAMLGKLVTAGLAQDGVVAEGDLPASEIVDRLARATYSGIQVSVPGSQWTWPAQLDGVQPGDQTLVYADLPPGKPFVVQLTGASKAQPATIQTYEVAQPLLERSWVSARIKRLSHQRDTLAAKDPDLSEALKHQIIDLSTKFRVLSDYTALLVLETEADYARFKIDRRGLSDILTVGTSGIEVLNRKNVAPAFVPTQQPIEVAQEDDRAIGGDGAANAPRDEESRPSPRRPMAKAKEAKESAKKSDSASFDSLRAPSAPSAAAPRSMGPQSGSAMSPPPRSMGGAAAPRASMPGGAPPMTMSAPEPPPPPPPPPPPSPVRRPEPMAMPKPAPSRPMAGKAAVADRAESEERSRRQESSVARVITQRPPQAEIARGPVEPEVVPYEGKLLGVMTLLRDKKNGEALQAAQKWRDSDAGDVLALIGLGETYETLGQRKAAARAYGSIIDLFPGRADLRRFAGERLERLGFAPGGKDAAAAIDALTLAADTFEKARASRADHPSSHRLYAYALVRLGRFAEALDVIIEGATRSYPSGRFAGVPQILSEDVGLIAAAWIRKEPGRRAEIEKRVASVGARIPTEPSVRFVLNWETDANDVDFHIYDSQGGHAYYSQKALPSGGELYADVTTGYGPECFTIPLDTKRRAYPYKLQAHYYSRGPMGYGMGKLEILEHDGHGGLRFAERPFVIMVDRAFVDLGYVKGPLSE